MRNGSTAPAMPMQDVRIVEMSKLIARPFTGKTLGEICTDAINIEVPNGDERRGATF